MLTPDKLTAKAEAVDYKGDTLYIRRLTAADLLNMSSDPLAEKPYYMAAIYWGDESNKRLVTDEDGQMAIGDMPSDFVAFLINEGQRINGTADADEASAEVEKP